MFSRLFALFVIVPIVELMLLIRIGQWVGLGPTLLLVLATGAAGAALARREGIRTLAAIQTELAQGRMPGSSLLDGAAILLGGAFLLTPGILTDLVGFSLLLPPTRALIRSRVRKSLEKSMRDGTMNVRVVGFGPGGFGGMGGGFGAGAPGFGDSGPVDDGEPAAPEDRPSAELGGPGTGR